MKKVIILGVIFAALLGFVYFYEIQGEKGREDAKVKEQSLLKLEENQAVTRLEVSRPATGTTLAIQKSGNDWVLRKPIETPADPSTVDGFVSALKSAKIERTFEKVTPKDLDKYGLASPRAIVKLEAGKEKRSLKVGSDDFTGNQVYIQLEGKPDVYLTSDYLYNSLDKQLKDWRSRKALAFDRNAAQVVEIIRPADTIRLKKQEEKWILESPIQDTGDEATVSGVLSALEFAEAQKFVAEEAADLAAYGLDKPEVTVRIREQGKDSWRTLQIGKKEGDQYLARSLDRTPVFTLQSDVRDKLVQPAAEFRDKSVVDVPQDQVAEISFRRGQTEVVVKQQPDGKWLVQKPDAVKGKEALSYKFWYPLTDIKFQVGDEKAKPPVLAKADVQVVVTMKNGTRRSFDFGQVGDEYVARKNEGGRQGKITKEAYESLQFKPEDIV